MIKIICILLFNLLHADSLVQVQIETENDKLKSELVKLTNKYNSKTFSDELDQKILEEIEDYLRDNKYLASAVSLNRESESHLKFIIKQPYKLKTHFNIKNEGDDVVGVGRIQETLDWSNYSEQLSDPASYVTEKVTQLYREYGYSEVIVRHRSKMSNFQNDLVFEIDPGVFTRLGKITVISKDPSNAQTFSRFIRQHNSKLDKNYGGYFRGNIEESVEALLLDLVYRGYLRPELRSMSETFTSSKEVANVQVIIDEGFVTRIDKVSVLGVLQVKETKIREILDINAGDKLNIGKLKKSLQDIRHYYTDRSFLNMEFNDMDKVIQYSNNQRLASVTINITEGMEVKIGNIIITGNTKTKKDVILKEVNLKPGGLLSLVETNRNKQRLLRTGLFTKVDILAVKSNEPDIMNVRIELIEKDPGVFNFGVGLNDEFNLTLRGFTGVYYDNIVGSARKISSRLELQKALAQDVEGILEYELSFGYLEPYIFGKHLGGKVGVTKAKNITSVSGRTTGEITVEDKTALDLSLEHKFYESMNISYSLWNFETATLFEYVGDSVNESQAITGSTGPSLEMDFRNHPFNPSKGWYYQSSIEYAAPFLGLNINDVDTKFYRLTGSLNYYLPIESFVFAQLFSGGYLINKSKNSSYLPETKGFFLGGRSTIRGYELNSIPDRSSFSDDLLGVLPIVDTSYFYLTKSELRFPITDLLGGVIFYDGGGVVISGLDFADEYRNSVGVGLRFATPVGPVSLEYGLRLDNTISGINWLVDSGRFHFSIGMF